MGRPSGGKNKRYSIDEKLKIVNMSLQEYKSTRQIQKETGVNKSVVNDWTKRFIEKGIDGLKNNKKTGNKFSALYNSKKLTKEERLELENMKLKIENERLKKGYTVKGVGANKEYVIFLEKNMK